MLLYLDVKADKVLKKVCGDRKNGRLYVTATKILMLPFISSAIRYSGLLVNLGSDLISIFTVRRIVRHYHLFSDSVVSEEL